MRVAFGVMFVLAALCMPPVRPGVSAQSPSPRTVLTIHDGAEYLPANSLLELGIHETLRSRPDLLIDYFAEYLESDVFPQEEASRAFDDYIRGKYQGRIDLVITTTPRGLRFAFDHRAGLFPNAPIVFATFDVPADNQRRMGAGAAGIRLGANHLETLRLALALHPSTERVFFVANGVDHARTEWFNSQLPNVDRRVATTFIQDGTVSRLLTTIKDVPPPRSLIIYQFFQQDTPGQRMNPEEVAPLVAAEARVPVYATNESYIGSGVIGGVMRDSRKLGTRLGAVAVRILAGTRAQDVPIEDMPVVAIFDWRAMQRFGISESRLPAGSDIRFRGPSLWRDYRRETLAALGILVLQLVMIGALLYQRHARQRAEVELTAIVEGSDDAIVSKDLSSTIKSWNRGAERIFGYTAQEMIGRSIRTIIPDDRWSEEEEVLRKIRRGDNVSHFETRRRRKDGSEVHVSLTISPIYSKAGVVVGASKIARDISDRKRAELESQRNLALAATANRRVTMTTLTGSIAHELGQPLNGILHNAQAGEMLIASQRATPEKLREILADIRAADLRATQIIERHRTMLRSGQLDKKAIDIHAVVRDSVALVADSIRSKQIQVDVELPPGPCFVVGDSVLLQQVVVNLMMNAMDAVAETPAERRCITVQNRITSGNVELSVRDAGTGLPTSVDGNLFEPFVTTKTNGMGIGLTIAHTIVEAHGGRIAARNNPEGGATFTVSLPCAEAPVSILTRRQDAP